MTKADENEEEKARKYLIKIEGVEGLWYEQPDMLSKYKRRPDAIEKISYTHFGKMIKSCGGSNCNDDPNEKGHDEEEHDETDSEDNESDQEDPEIKFHYIITLKVFRKPDTL